MLKTVSCTTSVYDQCLSIEKLFNTIAVKLQERFVTQNYKQTNRHTDGQVDSAWLNYCRKRQENARNQHFFNVFIPFKDKSLGNFLSANVYSLDKSKIWLPWTRLKQVKPKAATLLKDQGQYSQTILRNKIICDIMRQILDLKST